MPTSINNQTFWSKLRRYQKWIANYDCKTASNRKSAPDPHGSNTFSDFQWRKRARRRGIERANAAKSGSKLTFLKAFCLASVFKNVLATEGGEHIFVKISKQNASELKFHQKAVLQITFLMHIGSDPILGGSMCRNHTFCRVKRTSQRSANHRTSPEITGNRIRATPFSINLSIHLISSSLSIYLSIYPVSYTHLTLPTKRIV